MKDEEENDYIIRSLPDKSGNLCVSGTQSTIRIVTKKGEEKAWLQLGPEYSFKRNPINTNCASYIFHLVFISHDTFACIESCHNKVDSRSYHYLHVYNTDLVCIYQRELYHIKPQHLFSLIQDHVAVVGEKTEKIYHEEIVVKIFNAKGKKVKKIIIDKDIRDQSKIEMTPHGQLVTHSKTGNITVHHIFTLPEKLKKETESVLSTQWQWPKDLVSIVTDYAGFFAKDSGLPKGTFEEIDYPDEPAGFFARLRAKF